MTLLTFVSARRFICLMTLASILATGCGRDAVDDNVALSNDDSDLTDTPIGAKEMSHSGNQPPKGHWIGPDDPEFDKLEREDAERRAQQPPNKPQFESLMAALKAKDGDYAAALTSMGLHLEVDNEGRVTRISDPMLNGKFDDQEFALLSHIPTLNDIWLRGATITDGGLAILENMPQLKRLSLTAKNITDQGLVHLRHLSNLETLHLQDMQIDGSGLAHLSHPEIVTWLDLTDSAVTDDGLQQIARFSNVETLGLWGTKITDKGLVHLASCKRLHRLSLYDTSVTDTGVKHLVAVPELGDLELSDTAATDKCLDTLLRFPKLKDVSFGSDQISVSTLEKLKEAGIEVGHGQLLNVRRKNDLLRYVGMDFEVDTKRSSIRAFIQSGNSEVSWVIDVECTDKYVPDHMQPAHLEGPAFLSKRNWKELQGEEFRISFKEDELHPILPDNPSNIYVGWHAAPNNHRIKFLKRTQNRFLIDWHCEAMESSDDDGEPVWVYAEIPFTEVIVWSESPLTLERAESLMTQHFDLAEFHEPDVEQSEYDTRISFRFPSSDE